MIPLMKKQTQKRSNKRMITIKEHITRALNESKGGPVTQQWIDSRKPVMTRDGRQAMIEKVDYSQIPNIITGKVVDNETSAGYEWDDTGKCVSAKDNVGNPRAASRSDDLVRAC